MFTLINLLVILYYLSSIHSVTSRWHLTSSEVLKHTLAMDRALPGVFNFAASIATVLVWGMSIYVACMTTLLVPDPMARAIIYGMLTVEAILNLRVRARMTEAIATGKLEIIDTPHKKLRHAYSVVCDIVCIAVLVYVTGPLM